MRRRKNQRSQGGSPPCVGCRGRSIDTLAPVLSTVSEPVTPATKVYPVQGLQEAVIDGQLVVLEPHSGKRVLLNATAALIFTAIDAGRAAGDVVVQLASETANSQDTIASDVFATIDQLISQGMVSTSLRDDAATEAPTLSQQISEVVLAADCWYESGLRNIAGVAITIRSDQELPSTFFEHLSLFEPWTTDEQVHDISLVQQADDSRRVLSIDGVPYRTVQDSEDVTALVFDAIDDVVTRHAPGLRFHAGAVERDGRVVVILGQSGMGKSTLTAAMVQRGFHYVTDEVVVVDAHTFAVTPYLRPLDLDDASHAMIRVEQESTKSNRAKHKLAPRQLGALSTGGRVGLIVLLTGQENGRSHSAIESMPKADGLMALLPLTFGPTFHDSEALSSLAQLCESTPIVKLGRGDVHGMSRMIEGAFG